MLNEIVQNNLSNNSQKLVDQAIIFLVDEIEEHELKNLSCCIKPGKSALQPEGVFANFIIWGDTTYASLHVSYSEIKFYNRRKPCNFTSNYRWQEFLLVVCEDRSLAKDAAVCIKARNLVEIDKLSNENRQLSFRKKMIDYIDANNKDALFDEWIEDESLKTACFEDANKIHCFCDNLKNNFENKITENNYKLRNANYCTKLCDNILLSNCTKESDAEIYQLD